MIKELATIDPGMALLAALLVANSYGYLSTLEFSPENQLIVQLRSSPKKYNYSIGQDVPPQSSRDILEGLAHGLNASGSPVTYEQIKAEYSKKYQAINAPNGAMKALPHGSDSIVKSFQRITQFLLSRPI